VKTVVVFWCSISCQKAARKLQRIPLKILIAIAVISAIAWVLSVMSLTIAARYLFSDCGNDCASALSVLLEVYCR
jgi:uncharacterized membrane protein YjjP (DUF1212 family)